MIKKAIALVLSFVLIIPIALCAYADDSFTLLDTKIPSVLIGGDGDTIYDKDGNYLFQIDDLGNLTDGTDKKELLLSVVRVLHPFLVEGLLQNKWDNYYAQLEKEIGELFEDVRLDENGEPSNGSDISREHRDSVEQDKVTDYKGDKGYYAYNDYHFWYDWRLDPMQIADELHDYIEGIKRTTKSKKVALVGRCVGTNVLLAYVAKYGTKSLYGVGFDGTSSNGGEFISDSLSGNFRMRGASLERFLIDYNELGMIDLSSFALASVDLLVKSGAVDGLSAAVRATIYDKVMQGVTSALALSTFFTMPCYWGFVKAQDYDAAIYNVFGAPGSEKRVKYAGLIEKLDNYHTQVAKRIPQLMRSFAKKNVRLGIIAKYGFQIMPICASADKVADQYASVESASFGATTASLYDTLPEDYIAERVAQGKGKYISPDRKIDASTCMFPDCTWFTKGVRHGDWTWTENRILHAVATADRQLTVDDFELTQFIAYDKQTDSMVPMTQDNCNTEFWTADRTEDNPKTPLQRLRVLLRSLKRWIPAFFSFVKDKLQDQGKSFAATLPGGFFG